ncbi:hypothetical protein RBI72_21665 [Enterobacter hormaechei]|uniref:hypothetical protein n=1 Tax=Enterobacter cloacae complex TaxID=354276 RepID=UPI0009B3A4CA|nr:hypothetical protein [Enterobacter hormaechei]MCV2340007.1 hypothetical protein [Enterobacter hormaechei]MDQ2119320.1 hypothetical protein [Enterobacter hormaechei]HAS0794005.1 hypothetical protein [Enterobacter hormaechei subsp. steigerwaltii]
MSVKRYEWAACDDHSCHCDVVESTEGDMVDYEDYAALEARCSALTAENAYLLPKSASELSNAWVLHKYLIGIQAAIMYLDNGNKKAAQEWLYGTIAGPGFEFPDEVDDIDAWATHQLRGSISHPQALEIIKAETPATDAFLAEVRASELESLAGVAETMMVKFANQGVSDIPESKGWEMIFRQASQRAAQLRKGVQS